MSDKKVCVWSQLTLNIQVAVLAQTGLWEDELADGVYYFTEEGEILSTWRYLSEKAKEKAREDYLSGWHETHPGETMPGDDIVGGDEEFLFMMDGEYIGEKGDA
jgi:hypothetical protein